MKSYFVLVFALLSLTPFAQTKKEAYTVDYYGRQVVPDQYVREADVLWSKTVWRMLDLKQRQNHHFFFPERTLGKHKSLTNVLMELVKEKGVSVYDENLGNEFALVMTQKGLDNRIGRKEELIPVIDPVTEQERLEKITQEFNPSEITRYLLKEVWFFDKNQSKVDVRIVGICPVREYYREDDTGQEEPKFSKVGWFYFPEVEKHLIHYPAMNGSNEAWKWTFFDVFKHRYFESIIVQVGNMYNNRPISEYAIGEAALVESRRIEEGIRNFELDLWSY